MAFLSTLHWPQVGADLGVGGVSHVELLILYELWAGERLDLEKAVPRYLRAGRSISVSAVPFGPGRFLGALSRALVVLPGGIRRVVSCDDGANHCRLRHFWVGKVWVFKMSCCLVILLVLLLRCLVGSYTFGTALVNLLVGLPLGVFLLVVMFRVVSLNLLVLERFRGAFMLIVLSCLAWLVVLGCLAVGEFLGAFKSVRRHWKPQHTLQVLAGMGVLTMVPRFRGCIRVMRHMVLRTGLGLGRSRFVHVSRFCMKRCRN